MTDKLYDCIIVGGGAAGLNAATVLARARRKVIIIDAKQQSNHASRASHGVFGHDGEAPESLYSLARQQLSDYPEAQLLTAATASVDDVDGRFHVTTSTGQRLISRTVLLAQGMKYKLPDIPGLEKLWGEKAWHCAYCDGYEYRDKKLLIVTSLGGIDHTSLILPQWSRDLHYAVDPQKLPDNLRRRIESAGGTYRPEVNRLADTHSGVAVEFIDKSKELFDGIVIGPDIQPYDDLADSLGCERDDQGVVERDDRGQTSVAGVYVAGDQTDIMQQVNVAVASGHKAAVGINEDLAELDRQAEQS